MAYIPAAADRYQRPGFEHRQFSHLRRRLSKHRSLPPSRPHFHACRGRLLTTHPRRDRREAALTSGHCTKASESETRKRLNMVTCSEIRADQASVDEKVGCVQLTFIASSDDHGNEFSQHDKEVQKKVQRRVELDVSQEHSWGYRMPSSIAREESSPSRRRREHEQERIGSGARSSDITVRRLCMTVRLGMRLHPRLSSHCLQVLFTRTR